MSDADASTAAKPSTRARKKPAAKATPATKTTSANAKKIMGKSVPRKAPVKSARPRKVTSTSQRPRDGEVFDPEYLAHQMRMQGHPWRVIAEACGYSSDATACAAVTTYLQRAAMAMSKERAQEALQIELDSLDAMKAAWWARGVDRHDPIAASILLKINQQRSRLLENFAVDQDTARSRTVVITGPTEDYVAGLRQIVEGDPEG